MTTPDAAAVSAISLPSPSCPACSSGKNRFKAFSGAVPKGRLADLSGGGPRVARAAEGAGVDKGDTTALVAGVVGVAAIAAGLYAYLNAAF